MDKLVRVRRLLQRLDFLFQLPQKLEEAVEEGQYAKAIRYETSRFPFYFLRRMLMRLLFSETYFFLT